MRVAPLVFIAILLLSIHSVAVPQTSILKKEHHLTSFLGFKNPGPFVHDNSANTFFLASIDEDLVLLKISPNGDLIWKAVIGAGHFYNEFDFCLATDYGTGDVFVARYIESPFFLARNPLLRLRGSDGKTVWQRNQALDEYGVYHLKSGSPVQLFCQSSISSTTRFKKINPIDGSEEWSYEANFLRVAVSQSHVFGYQSSPNRVTCIKADSGQVAWQRPLDLVESMISLPNEDLTIITRFQNGLGIHKLSHVSGDTLWLQRLESGANSQIQLQSAYSTASELVVSHYATLDRETILTAWDLVSGTQLARRSESEFAYPGLSRAATDSVFFDRELFKLSSFDSRSLTENWSALRWDILEGASPGPPGPFVRPNDPLLFSATVGRDFQFTSLSTINGHQIFKKLVPVHHPVQANPRSTRLTRRGIVVVGGYAQRVNALVLNSQMEAVHSMEFSAEAHTLEIFANGDILVVTGKTTSRYSVESGEPIWTVNRSPGEAFKVSQVDDVFSLDVSRQFLHIRKWNASTGKLETDIEIPEYPSFSVRVVLEFAANGDPIVTGFLASRYDRLSMRVVYQQPIRWVNGFSKVCANAAPDGSVYIAFTSNPPVVRQKVLIRKLNRQTGLEEWQKIVETPPANFSQVPRFEFDSNSNALFVFGLYSVPQSQIIAISPKNGTTRWEYSSPNFALGGNIEHSIFQIRSDRLLLVGNANGFSSEDTKLVTLNSLSGTQIESHVIENAPGYRFVESLRSKCFALIYGRRTHPYIAGPLVSEIFKFR